MDLLHGMDLNVEIWLDNWFEIWVVSSATHTCFTMKAFEDFWGGAAL